MRDRGRLIISSSAAHRLRHARRFVGEHLDASGLLIVAATREAADEFAREVTADAGVAFGLERCSTFQLALRLALGGLSASALAPATSLAMEAVAARVAFEASGEGHLGYLGPIADTPGFPRALLATLAELRSAGVEAEHLAGVGRSGDDLAALLTLFDDVLGRAGLADRVVVYREARRRLEGGAARFCDGWPLVLLDVPIAHPAERAFIGALVRRCGPSLATCPSADGRTRQAFAFLDAASDEPDTAQALGRVQARLFEREPVDVTVAAGAPGDDRSVVFFSAPGEGREAVEIARRILIEAAAGTPFDRVAVALRTPRAYVGLLDGAFRRAGIPAWFARGSDVPDPAGRAFLALLACAREGLSARRFAEYLSLGQAPRTPVPSGELRWMAGRSDWPGDQPADDEAPEDVDWVVPAPRTWERLIVEASVVGGADRWERRLAGLEAELRARAEEERADDAESPLADRLAREVGHLARLRAFAIPIIRLLAALPARASWTEWVDRLEALAPLTIRHPGRVVDVLADLRPMTTDRPAVDGNPVRTPSGSRPGLVTLHEVTRVLEERLGTRRAERAERRYGKVFVGTPDELRARSFDVVFVPGLAERMFPQRARQDPLLLDEARATLARDADPALRQGPEPGATGAADARAPLDGLDDRLRAEQLLFALGMGAASRRVYVSYPRMQVGEPRARVFSLYAVDLERARTGRVPDLTDLAERADREGRARLAWPAPPDEAEAIDAFEHDLVVLRRLLDEPDPARRRGRARYLLQLSDTLDRSLRNRYKRWEQQRWTEADGLVLTTAEARARLDRHRLGHRPYSVSALQRFAACPYRFALSTIARLEPREEPTPLDRLDPLTRGRLFHRVQAETLRALEQAEALPIRRATLAVAFDALDEVLHVVEAEARDQLVPAIERVWRTEMAGLRADLRGWIQHVAEAQEPWTPHRVEFGFGFPPGEGRDPLSLPEPVVLDGGYRLHGIVDLVERRHVGKGLRITDHKTGRTTADVRFVVGGGEVLQPVLYGMAVERCLHDVVDEARLFYCTADGRYAERALTLDADARRRGIEVLEIVDRALGEGFLPAAPRKGACRWCDFRVICGPHEERRVARKDQAGLGDLETLRRMR